MIKNLLSSFDNTTTGYSARKLTAFAFVLMAGYVHLMYVDKSNAIQALMVDSATTLLCLGIVTAQNIINFKNGSSKPQ